MITERKEVAIKMKIYVSTNGAGEDLFCQDTIDHLVKGSSTVPRFYQGWFHDLLFKIPSAGEYERLREKGTQVSAVEVTGSERRFQEEGSGERKCDSVVNCADFSRRWRRQNIKFEKIFRNIKFGNRCDVCHRLWFSNDLKSVTTTMVEVLEEYFPEEEVRDFKLCRTCFAACRKGNVPAMDRSNGYEYPPMPTD